MFEELSFMLLGVKYILLLIIALKMYRIADGLFSNLVDDTFIVQALAVTVTLFGVYILRELFLVAMLATILFLYFFGWIGKAYGLMKA